MGDERTVLGAAADRSDSSVPAAVWEGDRTATSTPTPLGDQPAMTQHPHTEPTVPVTGPTDPPKLLRSGITIRATADRVTDWYDDETGLPVVDLVDITVQVTSSHPALVNLNAAAIGAHAALRAQLDEPAETIAVGL